MFDTVTLLYFLGFAIFIGAIVTLIGAAICFGIDKYAAFKFNADSNGKIRMPQFWGLHAKPGFKLNIMLAALPFILLFAAYIMVSDARLEANPKDKIMPSISKMVETTIEYAWSENKRDCLVKNPDTRTCEQYAYQSLLLQDTLASLYRIAVGVGMAAIVGLFIGIHLALYNGFRSTMNPIITFLSIVPPLALMPILLITMGTGDVAKIALIFIGTVFTISRDVYRATNEIPNEQITKALTLGAKEWEVVYKIVLPQIIPSLLETVRLSLGAAWLFLIAGEAVASQDGLGFRIYLVKRYMDMSAIIPYVLVITALGFLMDYLLRRFVYWRFPWYVALKGDKK